jgi:hypothetical protein
MCCFFLDTNRFKFKREGEGREGGEEGIRGGAEKKRRGGHESEDPPEGLQQISD